jgi:hypothetical protein
VAKFAASGKKVGKKDLGAMAMTYGYVYVAQVAMGANNGQLFRAMKEAEAYHGPSLIIAYSPCINHGIRLGMGKTQEEQDRAVQAGYWQLYRYNPLLMKDGKIQKNPTGQSSRISWTARSDIPPCRRCSRPKPRYFSKLPKRTPGTGGRITRGCQRWIFQCKILDPRYWILDKNYLFYPVSSII